LMHKCLAANGWSPLSKEAAAALSAPPPPTPAPLSPFPPPAVPYSQTLPRAASPLAEPPPAAPISADIVHLQGRYSGMRLSLQPRGDAATLSPIAAGVPLRVIETRETWLYVQTPDERRGWVLRQWIQE